MSKTESKHNFWKRFKAFWEHLLFPDDIKCIFCGRDIFNFDEKPFCEDCEKTLPFNDGSRCIICDEPIDNEATVCDSCQKYKRFFKKAYCPFVYQGDVRKAILSFKDSNQRYKAKAFAKLIAERILKDNVKLDKITYIPLTKKKLKERSFNQAKLLAEEIGKILNVEVFDLFEKVKDNKGQKFASFKQRQENTLNMYVLKSVKLSKKENVLIVDDIITTCATVNYCAGLISSKVKDIYVCAIARNKLRMQK